jgi:PTS system beta-glucosides-specific IIC component
MDKYFSSLVVLTIALATVIFIFYLVNSRSTKRNNSNISLKSINEFNKDELINLFAFAEGRLIPLTSVKDDVFASLSLGDGIAINPDKNVLYAPCNATVTDVAETNHAIKLECDNNIKILLHIGIDTVNLKGRFFSVHVKEGNKVKKGDRLISFDLVKIKYLRYDPTICMVVYGNENCELVKNDDAPHIVSRKDIILAIKK